MSFKKINIPIKKRRKVRGKFIRIAFVFVLKQSKFVLKIWYLIINLINFPVKYKYTKNISIP